MKAAYTIYDFAFWALRSYIITYITSKTWLVSGAELYPGITAPASGLTSFLSAPDQHSDTGNVGERVIGLASLEFVINITTIIKFITSVSFLLHMWLLCDSLSTLEAKLRPAED